ncbi:MAG TPA: DUF3311 domain-containing protein [Segeticoccus sp.]|uniref:DUF3311 domain-containing protein n=1 Tax=Segeticoccus sp. TaxID=2706531 RepID=UPI002D7E8460|nr:DUF3311 domain-containing protein [Segeticoccus sp.]HET8601773.1 DUF3311 domain-containing protein [Segeticoccus sp.]
MPPDTEQDTAPPANTGLLVAAGICVLIPIVALMWVGSYAREDPKLGPVPFFIWYQMMWVFLCAGFTTVAYRLVLKARPHRPMSSDDAGSGARRHGADEEGPIL